MSRSSWGAYHGVLFTSGERVLAGELRGLPGHHSRLPRLSEAEPRGGAQGRARRLRPAHEGHPHGALTLRGSG
eukprot:7311035-Pyramimonas_sp.AAC.1